MTPTTYFLRFSTDKGPHDSHSRAKSVMEALHRERTDFFKAGLTNVAEQLITGSMRCQLSINTEIAEEAADMIKAATAV